MTVPSELETAELTPASNSASDLPVAFDLESEIEQPLEPSDDDYIDDVEMGLFDHLEELRLRIFYALAAVGVGIIGCFTQVKPLVKLLQQPAQGVKFLQLAPGEFFFVSLKVAGYSGLVLAAPFILYQIIAFVTPGLTRREKRILGPVVLGSGVLFLGGLAFAYVALIPAALNFFISYGEDVVAQSWSIERYFELILLLMFSTGIAFQVPIVQTILGVLGIVSSRQMIAGWRYVLVGAAIAGAVLTPSTDPLTQSLLAGAVLGLYFSGIGIVRLLGK
jgi:sec-independent protein translocase protein TatC